MITTLSNELRSFRSTLDDRRYCSFFLRTFAFANLRKKVNTWIALAEELEDDLRLAERRGQAPATGQEATVMDQAINNVTRALVRVENSQNSRDEMPALRSLIAAAAGLRRAHVNLKISKGH